MVIQALLCFNVECEKSLTQFCLCAWTDINALCNMQITKQKRKTGKSHTHQSYCFPHAHAWKIKANADPGIFVLCVHQLLHRVGTEAITVIQRSVDPLGCRQTQAHRWNQMQLWQSQSETLTTQPSWSARAEHSLSQEIPHHAPYLLGSSRHRRERVRGSSATGTRGRARGWGRGASGGEGVTTEKELCGDGKF